MSELFNNNNTKWEHEDGDDYLVYVGNLEDLAKENNISIDKAYALLGEYEDDMKGVQ